MTNQKTFKLFGVARNDQKVFYTGRAGEGWVSANEAEAFPYSTYEAAKDRANQHNKWTALHGIHFVADCGF